MLFTFTLSNAESRGGRMNLKVLANVRRGWTDCRAATLVFFLCLREEGEDSERGETKFSAGVTVKFTAPTTMHVEEKQPESVSAPRDTWSASRNMRKQAVSDSTRIVPYRLDQSGVVAYTMGRLFLYPAPWAAAWTAPDGVKERAGFCLVFRSLNTTSSHRQFFHGLQKGQIHSRKHQLSKKDFFDDQLQDHYPRALTSGSHT